MALYQLHPFFKMCVIPDFPSTHSYCKSSIPPHPNGPQLVLKCSVQAI